MNEACEILQRLIDEQKINGMEAIILMRQMLVNNSTWNISDYLTTNSYCNAVKTSAISNYTTTNTLTSTRSNLSSGI